MCKTVTEEPCEEEYLVQYKEECRYWTVEDRMCSSGYSASYSSQCRTRRPPGRAPSRQCRSIPQLPVKTCRLVARQVPNCTQVPVKRPVNKCRQVVIAF